MNGQLVDRYIEAASFKAIVLVATVLTALFSLLEFVEQLAFVGEGRYRITDAFLYVLLTAPYRLLQVTPLSMLLGSLIALGFLGRHSELVALRSMGISERRIVGRIVMLAIPIAVVLFLLAEFVIPTAQLLAQERRSQALTSVTTRLGEDSFWAQGNGQYLSVQQFRYGNVPGDIDIYAFNTDGRLASFIHAQSADIRPDGTWLLRGVIRKRVQASQFQTERLASLVWHSFISASQTRLLILPPESMPPIALYRYVRALEQQHQRATRYERELWAKLSLPLSMMAMIMVAAPFAFGPPRAESLGRQVTLGAAIGIAFSLAQQIASHLDQLLGLDPAVTALVPPVLLMGLAVVLFRTNHR